MTMKSLRNGAFWTIAEQISTKALSLGFQIWFARVLAPEDFGLLAIIAVFINVGEAVSESGTIHSLIRTKNLTEEDLSSVFVLNIGIGLSVYLLIWWISGWLAFYFDNGDIINILRVYALIVPIKSFGLVHNAILMKMMDFKMQTIVQSTAIIIGGLIGLSLAYFERSVWALIGMQIALTSTATAFYWLAVKWRPKFILVKAVMWRHFQFGYKLMLATVLNSLSRNMYSLFIGKHYDSSTLGYYNRAWTFQNVIPFVVDRAVAKVTYPHFAANQSSISRLRLTFNRINKLVNYLYFPLVFVLYINAEDIIVFILTIKWLNAAEYFQILLIGSLVRPMLSFIMNILSSLGKSKIVLQLAVFLQSLTIVFLFYFLDDGIKLILWSECVILFVTLFIAIAIVNKTLSYPNFDLLKNILPEFMQALGVCLFVLFFEDLLILGRKLYLIEKTGIYFVLYALLSCIFTRSSLTFYWINLKNLIMKLYSYKS